MSVCDCHRWECVHEYVCIYKGLAYEHELVYISNVWIDAHECVCIYTHGGVSIIQYHVHICMCE